MIETCDHIALYKYFRRVNKEDEDDNKKLLPMPKEIKMADEGVAKMTESSKSKDRGKYNTYSDRQIAQIGKYAADHGPTKAAAHFSSLWKIHINESTARQLKSAYLDALSEACEEASKNASKDPEKAKEAVTVETLPTKEKKRPLILGEEMDAAVQQYIESLRLTGTVVNATVVMGAAEGIVAARDVTKLRQHDGHFYGGHINITKSLARSILNRMGYVKRKCSTAGKITISEFEEVKEVFLADVAAVAVMRSIPTDLIFNWDQTGLSIIPTGNWTMHNAGAEVVPIAHSDDKRQITAVLAANAKGEYLPPQLIYKGKTTRCHPDLKFPAGWDIWHSDNHWSNEDTMKRYLEKVIIPFVNRKRKELFHYLLLTTFIQYRFLPTVLTSCSHWILPLISP